MATEIIFKSNMYVVVVFGKQKSQEALRRLGIDLGNVDITRGHRLGSH